MLIFLAGRNIFRQGIFFAGILYVCFLSLVFSSCSSHAPAGQGYSKAFKPVFDTVSALYATNQTEAGLRYLDSAMDQIRKPNLDDKFRALSFHYVYWQKDKRNYQKALMYADSMLAIAKKTTSKKQYLSNYVEANMAIGDTYFAMQRFSEAYQHYFEGFRIGKNNLNDRALSDYSYRMGMILYKMGNFKLASGYFKESYRLCTPTNDKFADFYRQQEVLDNIGISYKHNNEPDSAILYFDKALQYINNNATLFASRQNMILIARGVVYGNKAEVLTAKGDYTGAIDLLKKSISINLQKGNDNSDAELAEVKLADIYLDRNETDSLYSVLSALKQQFKTVQNENAIADWNRLMSSYYRRIGNFEKALYHLQTYNILKDSISKKLGLLKESNVNEQLANFEKQYQIDALKNRTKAEETYLYVTALFALMALLIVFLVYRNWKRSRKDVKIVNELNKQINIQRVNAERANDELKRGVLEKDRILRAVAHDLRNPIGGIASLSLAIGEDTLTDDQKEMISLINETAMDTLALINEILEATGGEPEKAVKEAVDINALLNKSVGLLRFKAAEKRQTIELKLLDHPEKLVINREKIWRVMSNLISNAIKFSPENSPIEVSITDQKYDIIISVTDHGIGIPEEIQPKIFNMFSEAKRPGTAGEKSFGLGLSISKQILEDHKGSIWFESQKGAGTTFFIRLFKERPMGTNPLKNQQTNALTT